MESEHFRARGMFPEYDHPVDGKIVEAAFALKISGIRLTVRPAALHGEHSDENLRSRPWPGPA